MIFSIPQLIAYLSSICVLEPGDLIFTGTPAGVGMSRNRYLVEGDVIVSEVPGIGQLQNRCVAGRPAVTL
jgi:2-keto-4-pentenoate hydratase/2-oxohepta-3-ene-1,7-dioic acid hydratase in catechol pathway